MNTDRSKGSLRKRIHRFRNGDLDNTELKDQQAEKSDSEGEESGEEDQHSKEARARSREKIKVPKFMIKLNDPIKQKFVN